MDSSSDCESGMCFLIHRRHFHKGLTFRSRNATPSRRARTKKERKRIELIQGMNEDTRSEKRLKLFNVKTICDLWFSVSLYQFVTTSD